MNEINKKIYILAIFFIIISVIKGYSQTQEVLANIKVKNLQLISKDTLVFEINLLRTSERWNKFANATFELTFPDTLKNYITRDNYSLEYINATSELNTSPLIGGVPSAEYYNIVPLIRPGRFIVVVSGPEKSQDCIAIPRDTGLTVGKFALVAKNNMELPELLEWKSPIFDYQACAFKLETDSLIIEQVVFEYEDANLEMNDGIRTTINFEVAPMPPPHNNIVDFKATYIGVKKVQLDWTSLSEAYNSGYIVTRGLKEFGATDLSKVRFTDTVADYRRHPQLKGLGTRTPGRSYIYQYDTVQYRGEEYCYCLMYQDFRNNQIYSLDTSCVRIPRAVIVEAVPVPNPFSTSTTVYYKVDDDVYMTVLVYDLNGKLVQKLMEDEYVKRNVNGVPWEVTFLASSYAPQGLYDIVFIAKPIEDLSVELSRAVVKAQLIR